MADKPKNQIVGVDPILSPDDEARRQEEEQEQSKGPEGLPGIPIQVGNYNTHKGFTKKNREEPKNKKKMAKASRKKNRRKK